MLIGICHACKQRQPILYETCSNETHSSIVGEGVLAVKNCHHGHWGRHTALNASVGGYPLQRTP